MCTGAKMLGGLFQYYLNLSNMVKVDYQELSDEEQWELIAKTFKV
ncbi:hypothetical protein [Neobacillus niacini]|jgi:hypothetical protein|nr:hypothetical protein [Neobacillus niacini]